MPTPEQIEQNFRQVHQRIEQAVEGAGRPPGSVQLLAVSKKKSVSDIRALAAIGQRQFGESYLQEAEPKINALIDLALTWHYIGRVQRNKTKNIAACFDWVHSIDRPELAHRFNEQRPRSRGKLNVLIQVNPDDEAAKGGVPPDQVESLADSIRRLPNLQLRGLMTIPQPSMDSAIRRAGFSKVARCFYRLNDNGFSLDTLSMGMSGDLEEAIAEGATLVRVGTAIFGARE